MARQVERDDPHRAVPPSLVGEAAHIFEFLEDHFRLSPKDTEPGKPKSSTDSFPERVVLRAVFGRGGADLGPEIHAETWKPSVSPQPTREKLVELSNKFLGLAQRDCAALSRKQRYGIFVYSNVRGPSAYGRHLFLLSPGAREYLDEGPASDDDDTHTDRLLATALAHSRWQDELFAEKMSGLMRLQQDIILGYQRQQLQHQQQIAQMEADRRAWILATEEALSKKNEREIAVAKEAFKQQVMGEVFAGVKALLPSIGIYLAGKGQPAIAANAIRQFLDGLTDDQKVALLGRWAAGVRLDPGLLDEDQARLVGALADGRVEPARVSDLVASLTPEQMAGAQQILTMPQLQQLIGIARATSETASIGAVS